MNQSKGCNLKKSANQSIFNGTFMIEWMTILFMKARITFVWYREKVLIGKRLMDGGKDEF